MLDQLTDKEIETLISLAKGRNIRPLKIFGMNASEEYAKSVAEHIGETLAPHKEHCFEDGECYAKSSDGLKGNVRGHNVFVIQSLYSDNEESVADKFVKLCIMCGSLKDASAHEVTVVIPHLGWARQDRKTESRAPITTKYIARMLESCGIDRALFMDVHNLAAEQNAFRVPLDNLEAKLLHAEWCAEKLSDSKKIRVMTPDAGGLGRATRFRTALANKLKNKENIEVVHFDKVREKGKVVGGRVVGDIEDADVIAYDDMISTGGTMEKACRAVLKGGGRIAGVVATHGLFCGKANEVLNGLDVDLVVADTVVPFRLNEQNRKKLHIVETSKIMADAIWRIHSGTGSLSELL